MSTKDLVYTALMAAIICVLGLVPGVPLPIMPVPIVLQNIGMTVQLLPITGIPLPFISYGGSSLWSLMTGIGVVLSIYYHEPQRYQEPEIPDTTKAA